MTERDWRLDEAARWALLVVFVLVCLGSMVHLSRTFDEGSYFEFGRNILLGRAVAADMQRTPITALNAGLAALFGQADINAPMPLFLARIPTVFAAAALGWAVMAWARRLYGPAGMLVSGVVYVFCPTVIAHARIVSSDIYCTLFLFLAVFFLVRSLQTYRTSDVLWLTVTCALAVVAKQTGLLLGSMYGCIIGVSLCKTGNWRALCRPSWLLLFGVGFLVIVNGAYGFRFQSVPIPETAWLPGLSRLPLPVPQLFMDSLRLGLRYNDGKLPIYAYLLGEYSLRGWWYYFPVVFFLKTPLAFWALFLAHLPLTRRCFKAHFLAETALVSSIVVLSLFFVVVCRVQLGVRYLLPLVPFLCVSLGKLGLLWTRGGHRAAKWGIGLALVWYAASSLSYFPHFLQYGNAVIVHRIDLYRYFADSNLDWNQSDYYLHRYIESKPTGTVFVNPERPVDGTVIVNANNLLGLFLDREKYAWLRDHFRPVDHVAYNWLVFRTTGVARPQATLGNARDGR